MRCILSITLRSGLLCCNNLSVKIWKSLSILQISDSATLWGLCSYHVLPSVHIFHNFQHTTFATISCHHNLYWFRASLGQVRSMVLSTLLQMRHNGETCSFLRLEPLICGQSLVLRYQYNDLGVFLQCSFPQPITPATSVVGIWH